MSVVIELDSDAATTATIPVEGGSLSATGADGTTYTLEIPSTALVTGVEITMTPITRFAALDDSEWAGALGVQLEPAGLHLFDVATLRVEPASGVDASGWVAVASATDGVDAHMYPLLPDIDVPTLPITHFSEYVTGDGIEIPSLVPPAVPATTQAQLEREIHQVLEEGVTDESRQQLRDKYWTVIESILDRAATDCAYAERGNLSRAMSLVRTLDATGFSDPSDVPTAQAALLVAIENCIEELLERCFNPNLRVHVNRLLGLARQAQLAGASDARYAEIIDILSDETPISERCEVYGTIVFREESWARPTPEELRTDSESMTVHVNLRPEGGEYVDNGTTVSFSSTSRNVHFDEPQCPGPTISVSEGSGPLESLEPTVGLSIYDDDTALLFLAFFAPSTITAACGTADGGEGIGAAFDVHCGDSLTNGAVEGETIDFTCHYDDVADDIPGAEGIIIGVTTTIVSGQLSFREADS